MEAAGREETIGALIAHIGRSRTYHQKLVNQELGGAHAA